MTWEYKTLSLPGAQERQSLLSEMGLNGWELVAFEQGLAYFKRPKAEVFTPKLADAIVVAAKVKTSDTISSKKK